MPKLTYFEVKTAKIHIQVTNHLSTLSDHLICYIKWKYRP